MCVCVCADVNMLNKACGVMLVRETASDSDGERKRASERKGGGLFYSILLTHFSQYLRDYCRRYNKASRNNINRNR